VASPEQQQNNGDSPLGKEAHAAARAAQFRGRRSRFPPQLCCLVHPLAAIFIERPCYPVGDLSPTTVNPIYASESAPRRKGRRAGVLLHLLGAGAQILLKTGANQLVHPNVLGIITNPLADRRPLSYGVSTVLLVLALRDGETFVALPVIALTYVWVTMLSFVVFHDRANPIKLIEIAIIVLGVAVLGGSHGSDHDSLQLDGAGPVWFSHRLVWGRLPEAGRRQAQIRLLEYFNLRLAFGVALFHCLRSFSS